jgi:hypothetical protein
VLVDNGSIRIGESAHEVLDLLACLHIDPDRWFIEEKHLWTVHYLAGKVEPTVHNP